jgi:hypothetical protein
MRGVLQMEVVEVMVVNAIATILDLVWPYMSAQRRDSITNTRKVGRVVATIP